ncbi:MAG TPA: hypothetical protein VF332_05260 [Vicinamibacterales bacterium]
MRQQPPDRRPGFVTLPVLVALLTGVPGAAPLSSRSGQIGPISAIEVDVAAVDRDGRPVDGLVPGSFNVTVDGTPRRVLWVRHVSRGPGASIEALRRQASRSETLAFAAEPARNVLVVIDELSIGSGAGKIAIQAAAALVDRLGLDDRVGVLRIPMARDSQLALTTDRPEARTALRQVVGRAIRAAPRPTDQFGAERPATTVADPDRGAGDPDRAAAAERERTPTDVPAPVKMGDEGPLPIGLLPSLQAAITAMRATPGRKIVAVFSAGVPAVSGSRVDEVALAASASHAVVYTFGLPDTRDDPDNALDIAALERLARSTGGSFSKLGKNADRSLELMLPELSACYVLGLEPSNSDLDGKRHSLQVNTPGQPVTVHAPTWLVPRPDVDDSIPPSVAPRVDAPGAEPGHLAAVPAGRPRTATESKPPTSAARDLELQRLLAKAADYIAGYQREYSMLVADEHYVQRTRAAQRELRSDLLLVRPAGIDGWVSFRDVYEVDGRPIRDRGDRLKRLFLDQSPEAQAQLQGIKEESSRHNIGQVERNINVPLFALKFLESDSLWRSSFTLAGTKDVAGVSATRVSYQEVAKPTLVSRREAQDLTGSGWFLIDPASGAVVGTMMQFTFPENGASIEFVVRYERDADLGLWVPAEMTEVYSTLRGTTTERAWALDARAVYSRFRRFQVTFETEIKVVK